LPGEAQNIFKGVISFKGLTNYPPSGRIDLMSRCVDFWTRAGVFVD
jgi:hypothetical protein